MNYVPLEGTPGPLLARRYWYHAALHTLLTNDAETQAEFGSKTLSLARLRIRAETSRKSITSMMQLAARNMSLWSISTSYAVAILAFSTVSWVLSIVFVLDVRIANNSQVSNINVTLGINVPMLPDACRSSLTAANCTYDLATSAITSQLITHTPFTFANITFSGPTGTQGLPIGALEHFASHASSSQFGTEKSKYCLPVMRPKLVSCTPVHDGSRAKYIYVTSRNDTYLQAKLDTYEIIINPGNEHNQTYVVTSSKGGVMAVSRSKRPEDTPLTVVTGSGQYADLLSKLSVGQPITFTKDSYNETQFTLLCDAPYDATIYQWNWVTFSLDGGVMTAMPTKDICQQKTDPIPVGWLDFALEGATSINNVGDGYSKLINTDFLSQNGPDFDRMKAFDMSPLEYILSHIVGIVNTAWTATNADIAHTTPIKHQTYQHRYGITIEIKGLTILALLAAILILLCSIWQFWIWTRAVVTLEAERRSCMQQGGSQSALQSQLLDPLQLLAYGASASDKASSLCLFDEQRREAYLRDRNGPILGCGPGTLLPSDEKKVDDLPRAFRSRVSDPSLANGEELSDWSHQLHEASSNQAADIPLPRPLHSSGYESISSTCGESGQ
ncbi:MAG: hypothetical protein Q9227_009210 [Pyrenula ochraceoflavens]